MNRSIDTRDIAIRIFFYDGFDESTGEYYSLAEAFRENFVEHVDNRIYPTDRCSIIEWSFDAGRTWQR